MRNALAYPRKGSSAATATPDRQPASRAVVLDSATTALAVRGEPLAEDTYADWAQEFRENLRRHASRPASSPLGRP